MRSPVDHIPTILEVMTGLGIGTNLAATNSLKRMSARADIGNLIGGLFRSLSNYRSCNTKCLAEFAQIAQNMRRQMPSKFETIVVF